MTIRLWRRGGIHAGVLSALLAAGCSTSPEMPAPAATPATASNATPSAVTPAAVVPVADEPLVPVALPDLSSVAAPVRAQLQARDAVLRAALANPAASVEERAGRYGQLGDVLMAATFFDEARLCYRHAAALDVGAGAAIEEELQAYNPLIPDGDNLKATFMLEYEDVGERQVALASLRGVEHRVWLEVAGHGRVFGIADEDLDRGDEDKTSAVHFLRFQLEDAAIAAFRHGAAVKFGIDHPAYQAEAELSPSAREALAADLS